MPVNRDAAIRATEELADLLAGPLDECRRAIVGADIGQASLSLTIAMDRLRRIRRDLREGIEGEVKPTSDGTPST